MKKIAVIGTGIMGSGIASNFLIKGYMVYVWNRDKEKLKNLEKAGAIVLDTPKQAGEFADMVFEVTANDESSRKVWEGAEGILAGAQRSTVLATCATLSIKWINELINICDERELNFFDLPMTGGRSGAESGNLILLAGGDEINLALLKTELAAISKKVVYFGKSGSGMKFKLILNMLQAIHLVGFGEVMKIAKDNAMNLQAVGEMLAEYPGGTATASAWRFYQNAPERVNFSVKWIAKDLTYAKEIAKDEFAPLLDDVLKKFNETIRDGRGDDDWTIINR